MAAVTDSSAHLSTPAASFDTTSPISWPASYSLASIGEYPFGPPQDETPEAYAERRYLECLWMPEALDPLFNFVPSLRRLVPPGGWSSTLGPHPLHAIIDEHMLSLPDIQKKYRKTIPALLEKEGDAQDAEEACIWYAWTHAQPDDAGQTSTAESEDNWSKTWLREAERRECQIQILLRMLKLDLPTPPREKAKKRKKRDTTNDAPSFADVISSLEMLGDRIGIMRETAVSNLQRVEEKLAGKTIAKTRDWAQIFCEDVLKPLFEESLPEHYEVLRYHCVPPPSRAASPAPSEASVIEIQKPSAVERAMSRSVSVSSRAGSLQARSLSRIRSSREEEGVLSLVGSSRQSRSRSGSVEPSMDPDGKSRDRSRSVSFATRSAGGIRAPVQRPGTRPVQGPRGKTKMRQVNSAPGVGVGKPSRITAPTLAPRAKTTGPTTLVAATPQKPSRTINREASMSSVSLYDRLQSAAGGSQSQYHSQAPRRMSVDKSELEEFMVASPERLGDDFLYADIVLATPTKGG